MEFIVLESKLNSNPYRSKPFLKFSNLVVPSPAFSFKDPALDSNSYLYPLSSKIKSKYSLAV